MFKIMACVYRKYYMEPIRRLLMKLKSWLKVFISNLVIAMATHPRRSKHE